MVTHPDILCIGSVLWDIIGRHPAAMRMGDDRPGRISRHPGGVAMNIAVALASFGMRPAVLTAIGRDAEGDELCAACARLGIDASLSCRPEGLPTDRYMAIEGTNGLIAAIADTHTLEAAGEAILAPLSDGTLGSAAAPWRGPVALDGNLSEALLSALAESPLLKAADLRLAPASPAKAARLRPFLTHPRVTLYANLEEAGLLLGQTLPDCVSAAAALRSAGVARALVTDGPQPAALADHAGVTPCSPRQVRALRVTGAGDTLVAAHIAAEFRGAGRSEAFLAAVLAAAAHVAGEDPE